MTFFKWNIKEQTAKETVLTTCMVIFALFFIYPLIFVVINSFRPNADIIINPTGVPAKLFFGNYVQAWTQMKFPTVFLNTLLVTVLGTGGIIITSASLPSILALFLTIAEISAIYSSLLLSNLVTSSLILLVKDISTHLPPTNSYIYQPTTYPPYV